MERHQRTPRYTNVCTKTHQEVCTQCPAKKHLKSCVLCDKIAKPQPNRIKVSKNFKRFANSNDKFQFKKPQQWRMMQFIVFKI